MEAEFLEVLKDIRDTLKSDKYEYSDPITIGGNTGSYAARSPYNTECEWCLISASCGLLAGGSFAVGSNNTQPTLFQSATPDSFGLVSANGSDTLNGLPSYVGQLQTSNPLVTFPTIWQPLTPPTTIFMQCTVNSQSEVLVTVQFRRLLLRVIPDKPRQQPSTHTHPVSRAHLRRLAATSPMIQGFDARNIPGIPYVHEVVPISNDTANLGKPSQGQFLMGRNNKRGRD